jgi:hypothetical protein
MAAQILQFLMGLVIVVTPSHRGHRGPVVGYGMTDIRKFHAQGPKTSFCDMFIEYYLNPPTYDHFDQGRCYLTLIKSKLKLD